MSEPPKILVIDDDETVRESLATVLEEQGFAVDTAGNGKEAIEKAKASVYNLALIDIRLPDMEGTRLLTEMRETTPKMAKIMITGYPSLQNAIQAVNNGADGYLIKPFNMDNLLDAIKEQLKKQEGTRRYSEERVKEFIETRAREKGLIS
jgi:DNA-binding NtrC family response regulator